MKKSVKSRLLGKRQYHIFSIYIYIIQYNVLLTLLNKYELLSIIKYKTAHLYAIVRIKTVRSDSIKHVFSLIGPICLLLRSQKFCFQWHCPFVGLEDWDHIPGNLKNLQHIGIIGNISLLQHSMLMQCKLRELSAVQLTTPSP